MKKTLIIIGVILSIIGIKKVKSENVLIPNSAIRFRIIANSNSNYDQVMKMNLSFEIQEYITDILKDVKTSKEAKIVLKENIQNINEKIRKFLEKENYNTNYKLYLGDNYFPEKNYKGVIYSKGYYDSLVITLGEGKGNNWWCVLFPPLCLMEAEETTTNNIEYKFFIKEIIDKYF